MKEADNACNVNVDECKVKWEYNEFNRGSKGRCKAKQTLRMTVSIAFKTELLQEESHPTKKFSRHVTVLSRITNHSGFVII